jgi:hypothetical protein
MQLLGSRSQSLDGDARCWLEMGIFLFGMKMVGVVDMDPIVPRSCPVLFWDGQAHLLPQKRSQYLRLLNTF